ncbi:Gfo/Idh/MocA family oxidoreductase [Flavobacteriaceae bacterium F89]|uniref:Gfo/Idh/MocA family oxidoreductase n=1 Tax=Cerina litoralis TaxID=2874477 RepID=A0AAE3EVD3_9FLAO|nr:Gfo/Idh/MocA family oxidoreductase [Cerina litoralis]MCG2461633.1 Gfo/Idh/MocA family oxidoreductase [Cerina litoralis]
MATGEINVGLIGTKFMGKAHSNAYSTVGKFFDLPANPVLHSACGLDLQQVQALANKFGWQYSETDYKKLLRSGEIDLIDICTPNDFHSTIAVEAAKAGKHMVCEKPMARNASEAIQMYRAAHESGVINMMIFNYRFVPAIALAKKMIDNGKLGDIRHFNAVYYQDWLVDPSFPITWRHSKEISGSGSHGDMNAHTVDLARYLVGEFEAVTGDQRVFVKERPILGSNKKGDVNADDATSFIARFQNGAMGSFCATRMATGRKNFMRFELFGSKGSLSFNLERINELEYFDGMAAEDRQGFTTILVTEASHSYIESWWPPGHVIGWEHTFVHEISHLLTGIGQNKKVAPDFFDGVKCQIVLDAVARSSEDGKWITIEEFYRE